MRKHWFCVALGLLGFAWQGAPAVAACVQVKLGDLPVTMVGPLPTIPVKINGVELKMAADSGAFFSLLTPQAAAKAKLKPGVLPSFKQLIPLTTVSREGNTGAGLDPDSFWYGTAFVGLLGGQANTGVATARNFTISDAKFPYTQFLVAAPQVSGWIDGVVGNDVLSEADVEFDLANGVIRLFKPRGCGDHDVLAEWAAPDKISSVKTYSRGGGASDQLAEHMSFHPAAAPKFAIVFHVKVNGHDMRAILDSGSEHSYITRAAAKSAGVDVTDAAVQSAGVGGAIGRNVVESWIAPFQGLQIGGEEVKDAPLRIRDTFIDGADMVIGADFLLSHHVYVANSQHKLYFSRP